MNAQEYEYEFRWAILELSKNGRISIGGYYRGLDKEILVILSDGDYSKLYVFLPNLFSPDDIALKLVWQFRHEVRKKNGANNKPEIEEITLASGVKIHVMKEDTP